MPGLFSLDWTDGMCFCCVCFMFLFFVFADVGYVCGNFVFISFHLSVCGLLLAASRLTGCPAPAAAGGAGGPAGGDF